MRLKRLDSLFNRCHYRSYHQLSAISNHEFGKQIRSILKLKIPPVIGLAVSGGVDSMALAYLSKQFFKNYNTKIIAFTVDHGFRPESKTEAEVVTGYLNNIGGIEHAILTINWDPSTIPATKFETLARVERHKLLIAACKERNINHILLAHTLDDQLETFIMRLCSGSSIYGLAGMKEISSNREVIHPGEDRNNSVVELVRPLLRYKKNELQQTCIVNNVNWVDDPTNFDATFTIRNAIRKLLSCDENLPVALRSDSLKKTFGILCKSRNDIEMEAQRIIEFMINKELIEIDPILGTALLTEFEGFNQLRVSVKTLVFFYIIRRISPIFNTDYYLSSIDNFVRKIPKNVLKPKNLYTTGVRITVYREKKQKKSKMIELEQRNLFSESATPLSLSSSTFRPQMYSLWRQRIHREDRYSMIHIDVPLKSFVWSNWRLFDNRFWIRLRKINDNATDKVSVRLVYELSPVKQILNELLNLTDYEWPHEPILASLPFFMNYNGANPHELTTSSVIGFPSINKYDCELSGLEIECKFKQIKG